MAFNCPHCGGEINPAAMLIDNLHEKNIKTAKCEICDKEFTSTKKTKYCSNACRCKAYRMNKEAKKGGK